MEVHIDPEKILRSREGNFKKAQIVLSESVIADTDPYVPYLHGPLSKSAQTASDVENGKIVYDQVYAKRQYEGETFDFTKDRHPQATHHWFEVAKRQCLELWGNGVAKILGGIWRKA